MSQRALDLYAATQRVGSLYDEQPLRFCYSQSWIDQAGRSLSPTLPIASRTHVGDSVIAFFENLLPEGHLRELLQNRQQTSTLFGLLSAVGGDTASGFSLQPTGDPPESPRYERTSWNAIAQRGDGAKTGWAAAEEARLSLAGAQAKLLLMVRDDVPYWPLGSSPSSHILKPDILAFGGVWHSALNETFCQRLAAHLGLDAAEATYQTATGASLIRRYDRVRDEPDGQLRRLHQLDFCQLAGVPSEIKYESDGGSSLATCRRLLTEADVPLIDHQRFIRWIFFNLLIGNHDSHAKNLSILFTDDGPRLAPFYDLMSTNLYPGLAKRFAVRIGEEDRPGQIGSVALETCARSLGLQPRYFRQQGLALAKAMPAAMIAVKDALTPLARPGGETTLLERLVQHIMSQTRRMQARWTE